jgi:hypothetical protein
MNETSTPRPRCLRVWFKRIAIGLVVLLALIQFVPYGRAHTNPPVGTEPKWDSPRTRELAVRACFDCHSNSTTWPWYSHVAPVSWFLQNHVDGGRRHLNFSEFEKPQRHSRDAAGAAADGSMPMGGYTLLHESARLTDAESADLVRGLRATFGEEKSAGH